MAFVLVAEDDDHIGRLFRKILERAGHEARVVANGEEALKFYLRHPVDVVVTDMQMPRGDGLELIRALKGLFPDASIVAISGQLPLGLQLAQLSGAATILTKPISSRSLLDAIEQAIRPND